MKKAVPPVEVPLTGCSLHFVYALESVLPLLAHLLPLKLRMITYLEGLHKCPKQDADGVTLPEEFDETGRSEQPQEAQV